MQGALGVLLLAMIMMPTLAVVDFRRYGTRTPVHITPGVYYIVLHDVSKLYHNSYFTPYTGTRIYLQQAKPTVAWELYYQDPESNFFSLRTTPAPNQQEPVNLPTYYVALDQARRLKLVENPDEAAQLRAFFSNGHSSYLDGTFSIKTEFGLRIARQGHEARVRSMHWSIWQFRQATGQARGTVDSDDIQDRDE